MTYYEMIQQLCTEYPDYWDYYRIHRRLSPFEHFRKPRSFIRSTFQHAQKQGLINRNRLRTQQPNISEARAAHSISAFFLGFMLAKNLENGRVLHFYTKQLRNDSDAIVSEFSFSYIWTLLCLYHDYGYYLENNASLAQEIVQEVNCLIEQQPDMDFCSAVNKYPVEVFQKMYGQNHIWVTEMPMRNRDIYSGRYIQKTGNNSAPIMPRIIQAYINQPKIVFLQGENQPILFPTRPKEIIDKYFGYRLFPEEGRTPCIDHGIAGGLLFFDSMLWNYVKVFHKARRRNPDTYIENFSYNDKRFSFNQFPIFAYIADCIINHNIWRSEPNSEKGRYYKSLGLDELLDENYKKVNFYENPLLFVLSIADSIEPYKLFSNPKIDDAPYDLNQLSQIMRHTEIRFTSKSIIIKPPIGTESTFLDHIKEMKKWIDIKSSYRNGEVIITPIRKA